MRHYFLFFLLSIFIISCEKEAKNLVDVSGISVNYEIQRFDIDFYQSNSKSLEDLKSNYSILFPKGTSDSVWLAKMRDKDELELFAETQKVYEDFSPVKKNLTDLFKHIKYYNKEFEAPNIITILSNIDYEYRVIYANSKILLISLDAYLGKDHSFYGDYPAYIKENNTPSRIAVDVANKILETQIVPSKTRTFLGKMIAAGKKMYVLDLYIPTLPDAIKIGYSKEKMNWAKTNEEQVWRYFIEENLLYSTDTKLNKRFLDEAPFSKFYLTEDTKSPGRIGQWIGWQIVRSFMNENDVSLQTLLTMDEEEIFKKSNYKPKNTWQ